MAIAFQTKQDNTATSATQLTITKPTGLSDGDVLVALIAIATQMADELTKPDANWVLVKSQAYDFEYIVGHLFYKVITNAAGEPSSYTWSYADPVDWAGGIARYSGVDNSTPSDCAASGNYGNVATLTALSITTVTDNAQLVWAAAQKNVGSVPCPAAFTERFDRYTGGTAGDEADVVQAVHGASGNKTASGSAESWATMLWALRPVVSGFQTGRAAYSNIQVGVD